MTKTDKMYLLGTINLIDQLFHRLALTENDIVNREMIYQAQSAVCLLSAHTKKLKTIDV